MEEETQKEIIEKPKDHKFAFFKGLIIILTLISWGVALYIIFKTDTKPTFFIIVSSILTIIGIISFINKQVFEKFKSKDKEDKDAIPKPATEEQLKKKVKEFIESEIVQDHIEDFIEFQGFNFHGESIWYFKIRKYLDRKIVFVIINANYIEELPTILIDPKRYELLRAMKMKSKRYSPSDEPDSEIRIEKDLSTGKEITYKKTTSQKSKENKEKKEDKQVT